MAIFSRVATALAHGWNAFVNTNREVHSAAGAVSFGTRPDRVRLRISNERSILAAILTRLSIDAAGADIRHVRLDANGQYADDMNSGLQDCLKVEANIDQAARHFRQDVYMTMFDKGIVAVVPVDTTLDPASSGFDVKTMRVGEIVGWMPYHIRVNLYNEKTGAREQLTLEKRFVAIIENPMYSIMNEPNSTLQRLIRKLNLLDVVDEQSSSGKLDIIIQLPYAVKSETRRQQAQQRRTDLEYQLSGSKYGIAYVDATEKITQLNRPAENNLLKQVEYLMNMLYSQLGLTAEIMNGTADEKTMLNYTHRTIEPLVTAFLEAMRRAFLTKTARSQGQSFLAFRDPFRFVTMKDLSEAADVFIRGEVFSANDFRTALGYKPSKESKANQLRNPNMPQPDPAPSGTNQPPQKLKEGSSQNGSGS